MHDAGHIEALLQCECTTAMYQRAYRRVYSYKADRLDLAGQQQHREYIELLQIVRTFKENITAAKFHLREYKDSH